MPTLSNTSNRINLIEPTDEEIDASPYDHPTHWIARAIDQILAPDQPLARAAMVRTSPDGHFNGKADAAFQLAVLQYADAVLKSDPNPDKSNPARLEYRAQHVVTRLRVPSANRSGDPGLASQRWDARTFDQGPVVLAIANGPFYAVALVLRGDGLHVQGLDWTCTNVKLL
jgi:hypothetical protein